MPKSRDVPDFNEQDISNLSFMLMREAVFVFNEEGVFIHVNLAGARYFGVDAENVVGKNVHDFFPEEQANVELEQIRKVVEDDTAVTYVHTLTILEKTYHFSTRKHPVKDEKGKTVAVLSLSTDITEKNELKEQMRLQDEKIRELLEATQNSIWEEDFSKVKEYVDDLKANGVTDLKGYFDENPDALLHCLDLITVTDVNLAGMLVYGIESKAELSNFRVRDNLTEESLPVFQDEILALARGEKEFEARIVTSHPTMGFVHSIMHVSIWSGYEETWGRVLVGFSDVTLRERYRKELTETEERYRSLFEHASDAIFFVDIEENCFVDINLNAQKLLGYSRDELLKISPSFLTSFQGLTQLQQQFDEFRVDNQSLFEAVLIHKDGRKIPVEISAQLIELNGKQYALNFVRDISSRHEAEEKIKRQLRRISVLREIDTVIASSLDLHLSMGVLLDFVLSELEVDAADILLYDPTIMSLNVVARRGFRKSSTSYARRSLSSSFAGDVAMQGRQVVIFSIQDSERQRVLPTHEDNDGFVSYVALPLTARGETKGVLEMFHRSSLLEGDEWMNFAEALAGQAAIALENITLFQNLKKANIDLSIAYDTTLEGWSKALEFFDHDTEGHTRRVTNLTMQLAAALRVPDSELVHMRRGALLHDIGKMAVPSEILNKRGQLNEDEHKIIRQHPWVAYNLLSPIPFLRPALDIPYCHHEKWDGNGYPRGLKGDEIPLAARIFSVADVWDALTTDRPYRKAWTRQKVLNYIYEESGHYFDPMIVDVFAQIAPTLKI